MVQLEGYDKIIKRVYDNSQEHVFRFWDELNPDEKQHLCNDLSAVDFDLLRELYQKKEEDLPLDFTPAPYISLPRTDAEKKELADAVKAGVSHIKAGKVAAFIVAGGQGSRLGFDGPKGKFPVGPVSGKTLFEIHAEKIYKYNEKYDVTIPFLILTSTANHDETVDYFEEKEWFGLGEDNVRVFSQNMVPSLDSAGKLVLKNRYTLFKNPDGHGGSLTALHTSGMLEFLQDRGIDIVSYFQVDNPLVKIVDPAFIGFHVLRNADISSKALKKDNPAEKVGVFVAFPGGKIGVVEYSDLPEEKAGARNEQGDLLYSAGSIAIHLFDRAFIEKITGGGEISLPFHTARKKIQSMNDGTEKEIEGFKFEKFVFDALLLTDRNVIVETLREEEFAPVKNKTGVDSVESAQSLMDGLYRSWLTEQGIAVPSAIKRVEISPLCAVEAADLDTDLIVPDREKVLIE